MVNLREFRAAVLPPHALCAEGLAVEGINRLEASRMANGHHSCSWLWQLHGADEWPCVIFRSFLVGGAGGGRHIRCAGSSCGHFGTGLSSHDLRLTRGLLHG